ncbi:MAG TPA: hypothetical protein VF329_04920 [Gammaproteobacteria bacterium]
MRSSSGEDVSIGYNWRASIMANSARDPYWHAGVRREVMDHPEAQAAIEDTCSTCHMPMARFESAVGGGQGKVFRNLAAAAAGAAADAPAAAYAELAMDGVSCTVCHQIRSDNLGEHASFDGGFVIDTTLPPGERAIFGPHDVDPGRQAVMRSAARFLASESTHLQQSEVCATCHTLYTSPLNEQGEVIGELPEQVPYIEWLNSSYRDTSSCQSCHMPELDEDIPITSVLGQPRPNFSQHVFQGGNAFMLGILNKRRGELGVIALPQELDAEIARTKAFLRSSTARVGIESERIDGRTLAFDVVVENLAGHKFPTAYPSRRAWLHVAVTDASGTKVFESGAMQENGAIAGNDNDLDGSRYEPHYDEIRSADQVQIYEPIMVDEQGAVTTGLLKGVRYVKDNRLLPQGFDKENAPHDVAVQGAAAADDDFSAGGDRVRYRVALPDELAAPLRIEVRLLFQSIGRRWAENLRAYDAEETRRFVSYYDSAARDSAVLIAEAWAELR